MLLSLLLSFGRLWLMLVTESLLLTCCRHGMLSRLRSLIFSALGILGQRRLLVFLLFLMLVLGVMSEDRRLFLVASCTRIFVGFANPILERET